MEATDDIAEASKEILVQFKGLIDYLDGFSEKMKQLRESLDKMNNIVEVEAGKSQSQFQAKVMKKVIDKVNSSYGNMLSCVGDMIVEDNENRRKDYSLEKKKLEGHFNELDSVLNMSGDEIELQGFLEQISMLNLRIKTFHNAIVASEGKYNSQTLLHHATFMGLSVKKLSLVFGALESNAILGSEIYAAMRKTVSTIQGTSTALLNAFKQQKQNLGQYSLTGKEVIIENLKELVTLMEIAHTRKAMIDEMRSLMQQLIDWKSELPKPTEHEDVISELIKNLNSITDSILQLVKSVFIDEYELQEVNAAKAAKATMNDTTNLLNSVNELIRKNQGGEVIFQSLRSAIANVKSSIINLISRIKLMIEDDELYNDELTTAFHRNVASLKSLWRAVAMYLEFGNDDKAIRDDIKIWDEVESQKGVVFQEGDLKLGTLNRLVIALTTHSDFDVKYSQAFLATYKSFTTPLHFLNKMIQRYDVPESFEDTESVKMIKLRVVNTIKNWIETYPTDFNSTMLRRLENMINTKMVKEMPGVFTVQMLEMTEKLKDDLEKMRTSVFLNTGFDEKKEIVIKDGEYFLEMENELIVQVLCLLIKPEELLNQAWNKSHLKSRAPNVTALIQRFNMLSEWTQTVILTTKSLKNRVSVWAKLIRLAERLRELNNFHAFMAILSGMDNSSVHRLKLTAAEIPKPIFQTRKRLASLINPEKSFHIIREALLKANPPALPYIGIFLQDLTFIEDGNPNKIDGFINFTKREFIFDVIKTIQLYQLAAYEFELDEEMAQFCQDLPRHNSSKLYELSLIREPRDATKAELFP